MVVNKKNRLALLKGEGLKCPGQCAREFPVLGALRGPASGVRRVDGPVVRVVRHDRSGDRAAAAVPKLILGLVCRDAKQPGAEVSPTELPDPAERRQESLLSRILSSLPVTNETKAKVKNLPFIRRNKTVEGLKVAVL